MDHKADLDRSWTTVRLLPADIRRLVSIMGFEGDGVLLETGAWRTRVVDEVFTTEDASTSTLTIRSELVTLSLSIGPRASSLFCTSFSPGNDVYRAAAELDAFYASRSDRTPEPMRPWYSRSMTVLVHLWSLLAINYLLWINLPVSDWWRTGGISSGGALLLLAQWRILRSDRNMPDPVIFRPDEVDLRSWWEKNRANVAISASVQVAVIGFLLTQLLRK